MLGYEEAAKIDQAIGDLLEKEPISVDNWQEWLRFIRTVQTSLDLLNHHVMIARGEGGGED
jgi:hypothetical protein